MQWLYDYIMDFQSLSSVISTEILRFEAYKTAWKIKIVPLDFKISTGWDAS